MTKVILKKGNIRKLCYGTIWGHCENSTPEASLRNVEIYETCFEYSPPLLPVPSLPFRPQKCHKQDNVSATSAQSHLFHQCLLTHDGLTLFSNYEDKSILNNTENRKRKY